MLAALKKQVFSIAPVCTPSKTYTGMRASAHFCVLASECPVVSSILTTELLHRRDRPFGCLLVIYSVLLLCGDLTKSLISVFLAERRFRLLRLAFSTVPALSIASYTPALRPNLHGFDGSTFSVCLIYQYKALRVATTLAHKQEWNGVMTYVVDGPTFWVQTGDLQMPRAPCSRKTTRTPHACTYILGVLILICTLVGTYFVCCFVQGSPRCAMLCCAVLCSRFNDIHTRTVHTKTAASHARGHTCWRSPTLYAC